LSLTQTPQDDESFSDEPRSCKAIAVFKHSITMDRRAGPSLKV
jgi:hypothetical protein